MFRVVVAKLSISAPSNGLKFGLNRPITTDSIRSGKRRGTHFSQSSYRAPQYWSGTANHSQSPGPMLKLTEQQLRFSWCAGVRHPGIFMYSCTLKSNGNRHLVLTTTCQLTSQLILPYTTPHHKAPYNTQGRTPAILIHISSITHGSSISSALRMVLAFHCRFYQTALFGPPFKVTGKQT